MPWNGWRHCSAPQEQKERERSPVEEALHKAVLKAIATKEKEDKQLRAAQKKAGVAVLRKRAAAKKTRDQLKRKSAAVASKKATRLARDRLKKKKQAAKILAEREDVARKEREAVAEAAFAETEAAEAAEAEAVEAAAQAAEAGNDDNPGESEEKEGS